MDSRMKGTETMKEVNGVRRNENKTEYFLNSEKSLYGSICQIESGEQVKQKKKYTRSQWLTLITLAFGNFCAGACVSLQAPFFPSEAEKKGATATEYGFIFGIFQLAIFVTAPIMGKIVSNISPKFLLNTGILTVGVTCILFGTLDLLPDTTTFVALAFVIRTIEGVGTAAMRTSCYTIIASQFTEGLGTTFAILETFLGVGYITGPTLGGALYDLGGYGLPFWSLGTVVVVDALVIFFFLPDIEKPKIPQKSNMLKFWLHPRTMLYSLSVFTAYNYIGFYQATLEPHLRNFNLSGVLLGMMFALSGAIYAITAPVWGWLCDKKCSSLSLSLLGCLVTILSLLLIGPAPFINTGPHIWIVIISLILMGLGLGAKLVCAFTGTLQDTMNRGLPQSLSTYGLVSSMIAASQSLGAFVGPSVGGYLLDYMGFRKSSMALLVLETVLILFLIVSICNRGNWSKKAELTHSTEKICKGNRYLPKDEEYRKNGVRTINK